MSPQFFQNIEKTSDDVIFPVSVLVSKFAGIGLKIKVETGLCLDLERVGLDYSPGK